MLRQIRVYDVPDADAESGSDPYLIFSLADWPAGAGDAPQTRTKDARNTQHPQWDGPLLLRLPPDSARTPHVRITLLDYDPGEADGDDELCRGEVRLEGRSGAVKWTPLPGQGEFPASAISFDWEIADGVVDLVQNPRPVGAKGSSKQQQKASSSQKKASRTAVPSTKRGGSKGAAQKKARGGSGAVGAPHVV